MFTVSKDTGKRFDPSLSEVALIKGLLRRGVCQHTIASFWGTNQGRISEINTGKKHVNVTTASDDQVDWFLATQKAH
ncbi:hypothetical protein TH8_10015 [Thalassospira profundimaris]|nr:hypothetical protein TH8_10015 [Thalassospira profundimaris]